MAKKEGQLAFLKEYARDVSRDYEDVADLFDALAEDLDKAYEIVTHFCARVIETEGHEDFPAKILVFYNEGITNPKERLKAEEVKKLRALVERYGQGLEKHRPGPRGKENLMSQKNLNEDSNRRGNQVMQTERSTQSQSTAPGEPPLEFETEGQLLDWILENNGVREDKRMRIMHMFEAQKQALMANPQSFWYFLQDSLTPQAANATYHAFMRMGQQYVMGWQYRQQYAQQTNGMPMQPGGMGMGGMPGMGMMGGIGGQQQAPFGMPGMGIGGQQGGTLQEYLAALMFEDRMEERRYRRHDRQVGDYMGMNFAKMMDGNGQGQGNNGGMNPMVMAAAGIGAETIFDDEGRVKGVRYLPGAGNKNDGNNMLLTTFMNNTQSMINTLLNKDGAGGSGQWEKIFQFLVQRDDKRTDPLEMARNMKELVTTFGGGSKTIDEVKLLLDAKLGLKHEDREDAKLNHEWEMQKLEKTDQSDMMKQYLQTIMGLKDEVLPYIAAFLKGGQANRAGLQRQPMPSPYGNAEMAQQQQQAQAQQAAYNAQMQAQAQQEAQAQRAQEQYYQNQMGQPQQYEYAPPPPSSAEEGEGEEQAPLNPQQLYQSSPEQLMEVKAMAEQKINEVGNLLDVINQEFARRNQMIARMQQRAAQQAEAQADQQNQRDNLEFTPTRTDVTTTATQTNPPVEAAQVQAQQSIYVSMDNEEDAKDTSSSSSQSEFPGGHGVTIAYDPVKDEPEYQHQQQQPEKKGFVHSEDFSSE